MDNYPTLHISDHIAEGPLAAPSVWLELPDGSRMHFDEDAILTVTIQKDSLVEVNGLLIGGITSTRGLEVSR